MTTLKVVRNCDEAFGGLEPGLHRGNLCRNVAHGHRHGPDLGFDTLQSQYDNPMVMDLPANIVTIEGKTVYNRTADPT